MENEPSHREPEEIKEPKERLEDKFVVSEKTVASERHPETNEDAFFSDKENLFFGLFDGIGGHIGGEIASNSAKDFIGQKAKEFNGLSLDQAKEKMREILTMASEEIRKKTKTESALSGMGTTASLVKFLEEVPNKVQVVIGNIGDSRVYLFGSARKKLKQVTIDDGPAYYFTGDEKKLRKIQDELNNVLSLKEIKGKKAGFSEGKRRICFEMRSTIIEYLGTTTIKPHVFSIDIKKGDKIIIMSDGVPDNLTDKEMEKILKNGEGEEELIQAAIHRSHEKDPDNPSKKHLRAKMDDMSVILVQYGK